MRAMTSLVNDDGAKSGSQKPDDGSLTGDDVDTLVSYILSLRKQYRMAIISSRVASVNDGENKQLDQLREQVALHA